MKYLIELELQMGDILVPASSKVEVATSQDALNHVQTEYGPTAHVVAIYQLHEVHPRKTYYDEDKNQMLSPSDVVQGSIFAIAALPDYGLKDTVGLFSEDDDNYFLKTTFSRFWLKDLADVAARAQVVFPYTVRKSDPE